MGQGERVAEEEEGRASIHPWCGARSVFLVLGRGDGVRTG